MAKDATYGTNPTFRDIIGGAFAFVRSHEQNKSTYGLTLDHLIEQQIALLDSSALDKNNPYRPIVDSQGEYGVRFSRKDHLLALKVMVDAAVQRVADAGSNVEKLNDMGIYEVDAANVVDLRYEDATKAYADPLEDPLA